VLISISISQVLQSRITGSNIAGGAKEGARIRRRKKESGGREENEGVSPVFFLKKKRQK
jgi:hypothetical protein